MAATTFGDVKYRTVTAAHAAAEFPSLSPLIASGAVAVDANPPFRGQGGVVHNVPHFLEITTAATSSTAATDATPGAISAFQDVGIVCERINPMGVEDVATRAIGTDSDIGGEILRQSPNYWAKQASLDLYSVLQGAFGSAMSSTSYFVKTFGTTFNRAAVLDVMKMSSVGDQWGAYKIWVMHSKQFADAVSDGIVNYVSAGAFGERLLQTGDIPTIFGKQVVVDDNLTETDGSTYLLKPNAMYLGIRQDFGVEYQRIAIKAGGTDVYMMHAEYMPHLYGLTFNTTVTPRTARATLATGGTWSLSQTTDYKLHRAVKIQFVNS
jgi:hypothetical protein